MRRDALEADRLHVVDRRGETDGAGDVRRARLEAGGDPGVAGLLEGDALDHRAAALPGRHRLEKFAAAPQRADSRRSVELVTREGVEVAAERLHVDGHVGRSLGAVHQHRHVLRVRHLDDLADGIHGAERVRDVRDGDEPRARTDAALELIEQQLAAVVDRRDDEARAARVARHLPRHQVRVVLHRGDQDLVAGSDARAGEARGDQVDRLGGAAQQDHFAHVGRIQQPAHGFATALVRSRRALGQFVDGAVHAGVAVGRRSGSRRRSPRAASGCCWRCRGRRAACRASSARGSGSRRAAAPPRDRSGALRSARA